MPRPPRIDFPDAVYHVTSRGNGRADILRTDDDRQRFLGQLAHHLQMTGVVLYAYVLMDNHFHGMVRTPRTNISAFMQRLLTAYALYARYKHRRPGHLFQGRFKAKLVEDDVYVRAVTRYIHLNPVKIAACRRLNGRQRRERLKAYPWSSYAGYVAASRYAIGGTAFTEKTAVRIEKRRGGRVQDRDVDLPRGTVALEEIDAAVARRYGVDPAVLKTHGHHAGPAKAAAVALASRLANLSGRLIGQHYGIGSAAIGAIHRRLADRPDALGIVESLTKQLRRKKIKYKA